MKAASSFQKTQIATEANVNEFNGRFNTDASQYALMAVEPSYGTVDLTAEIMPVVGQTHLEHSNLNAASWLWTG